MLNDVALQAIEDLVRKLVRRDYDGIARMSQGRRFSSQELQATVDEYGRTLVMPPTLSPTLDAIEITGAQPPAWSVNIPMWTREEGRSDLTLELTVRLAAEGCKVEVDNLHVL